MGVSATSGSLGAGATIHPLLKLPIRNSNVSPSHARVEILMKFLKDLLRSLLHEYHVLWRYLADSMHCNGGVIFIVMDIGQ